jgi:hypothetical protein
MQPSYDLLPDYGLRHTREVGELTVCNSHLDDPQALQRFWEENGYWCFQGVIDLAALRRYRAPILKALKAMGLVDADEDEPRYGGRGLERFPPARFAGYEPLPGVPDAGAWEAFLAEPPVDAFFTRLLGVSPAWVPVSEVRVLPPNEADPALLIYPHQDGFYNEGYRFMTVWFPLWASPRAAGGLALAGGCHRHGYLNDLEAPPRFPIRPGRIPNDAWRTASYQAGDVVIFDRRTPHSGLRNRSSDRFRVSLDVRCVLPGDPAPVVGWVEAVSADRLDVRDRSNHVGRYLLDTDSFCRAPETARRIPLSEVPQAYPKGRKVMLTLEGDRVRMLRIPKE